MPALWLGGASGSGKTTIAKRITRRHGLRWYNADAHTWEHRDRALADGHPGAVRWEAMTPHERWVSTPAEMLELSIDRERWPMIAEDVADLPRAPLVLAEGTTVLPALVAAGIADRSRAVWLVPTEELQRERLEARGLSAPAVAYQRLLGAEIERGATEAGVRMLRVDRIGERRRDNGRRRGAPRGCAGRGPARRRARGASRAAPLRERRRRLPGSRLLCPPVGRRRHRAGPPAVRLRVRRSGVRVRGRASGHGASGGAAADRRPSLGRPVNRC